MKTNKYFNFKRFYRLLSCDLRMNGKRYLSFLAGGMVIFYLILVINMEDAYSHFGQSSYITSFIISLFGLGLFVGSAFPELSSKAKTGNYLLLPASTFEKTASQFLICFVFGSIFFLLIFWVDTYLAKWTVLQMESVQRRGVTIADFHYHGLFDEMLTFLEKLLIVMMVISTGLFMFAARLFFKRFALVKSVITLIAAIFLLTCFMVMFSHIFYPETKGFDMRLPTYFITPGVRNIDFLGYILILPLWAFFLPLAYYKLKEKQV